jgi:Mn2+/Fe2+ NRAMP family transporter
LFSIWNKLGPGLLFAGSAVGVSHIYQSTRAGAEYGWALLGAVLIANLLKYPFFEFGPRYALATGETLMAGYRRMGRWVLGVFIALTVATMFAVQAAIAGVTAALAQHILGLTAQPWVVAAVLLGLSAVLLLWGRYRMLDRAMKMLVLLLSTATLIAVVLAYLRLPETAAANTRSFSLRDPGAMLFLIALMGWMPAPLDLSVWHSAWALEKKRILPSFDLKTALFDFRVGYAGTALLAVAFLALGARLAGEGEGGFPATAAAFSALLIDLYRQALGSWAGAVLALAALATMLSTNLTVLDAMPRVLSQALLLLPARSADSADAWQHLPGARRLYIGLLLLLACGAALLLSLFAENLRSLVDLATSLSFLTAPFFALINLALVRGRLTPPEARPGFWLSAWSAFGILYLLGFSILYLQHR